LDTRRIEDCFAAVDYFEDRDIPLLIAVNNFDRARRFDLDEVREALGIGEHIPILECDARARGSVKQVLVELVEQIIAKRMARTR
jgi:signal recognition particle receptor subunit beta